MQVVENAVRDQLYHNASGQGQQGKIIQDDMLCTGTEGPDSCYVSPTPSPPPVLPRLLAATQPSLSSHRATLEALWSARRRALGTW